MTTELLKYIVETSTGLDDVELAGSELFEIGSQDDIYHLLRLNVLKETAILESIFCQEQCTCDDELLLVERIDDSWATIFCPSGQISAKKIPINEVRCFRFCLVDFLRWVCQENGYHPVPGRNQEVCDGIYHFADTTLLERNLSLCIVTGSTRVNLFERLFFLSEIFPSQLVVALSASPVTLSRIETKNLAEKEVFVISFTDVIKLPLPTIDLALIERRLAYREQHRRPALILQMIPTGTNRGTVVQLAGRLLKNRVILLGRNQLLIIHALMNAHPSRYADRPVLALEEKEFVKKHLLWHKRKWITVNLSHNEKPKHRLNKMWYTFIKQMKQNNIDNIFVRNKENGIVKYILALDGRDAACRITDIASAVQKTANSGRRPKDDPLV